MRSARAARLRDPPELLVRGEGQSIVVPTFEELRERVLQERKGSGLMGDVGDHLRHQTLLGPDAHPFARASDRLLELVGCEGRNGFGPLSEQLSEARIDERAVVEVRPEGHDDVESALGVDGGDAKHFQEQFALALVRGEREDLLELIDHEHDLSLARRDQIDRLERPGSRIEPIVQAGHWPRRDPQERGLELVDRVRREHLGHEGIVPAPQRPSGGGNQPRTDDR